MASVFLYHVVGYLTVGKRELVEFNETQTVEWAIQAIGESPEGCIPIWKKRSHVGLIENSEIRQQRFVGMLNSLDIVAFLAKSQCLKDQDMAMKTPVSEVVVPNNSLLRLVDPGTREDVLRFIIGCLGALAPLPLTSITVLGGINSNYSYIESSSPAIEAIERHPQGPSAVAAVESTPNGERRIIGEISACQLWKCDYLTAAWALASLSAGQFVMGVEDNVTQRSVPDRLCVNSATRDNGILNNGGSSRRSRKFSSSSNGFIGNPESPCRGSNRSMYRVEVRL